MGGALKIELSFNWKMENVMEKGQVYCRSES